MKFRRPRKISYPKNHHLRRGEVVRVRSSLGLFGEAVFRVESADTSFIELSAGEISISGPREAYKIVERNLPEPESWLLVELEAARMLSHCDCDHCRLHLDELEARARAQGLLRAPIEEAVAA